MTLKAFALIALGTLLGAALIAVLFVVLLEYVRRSHRKEIAQKDPLRLAGITMLKAYKEAFAEIDARNYLEIACSPLPRGESPDPDDPGQWILTIRPRDGKSPAEVNTALRDICYSTLIHLRKEMQARREKGTEAYERARRVWTYSRDKFAQNAPRDAEIPRWDNEDTPQAPAPQEQERAAA